MKPNSGLLPFVLFLLVLVSCNIKSYEVQRDRIVDGRYDSEYPARPVSEHLGKIMETVHMISILAFYESIDFRYSDRITLSDIADDTYQDKILQKSYFQKPASGTATLIYYRDRHLALLTCAHILNFPDTLYAFYKDENDKITTYLHSFAVKTKQNNHIIDIPDAADFEVLAMDEDKDIALIGKHLRGGDKQTLSVFNYPSGSSEELDWGTLVYLMGYPRGKLMLSTALVSSPNRDRSHSFLINASFPRGISGGLVLALRDGVPNFEVVGMINAISAESKHVLAPDKKQQFSDLNLLDEYTGDIYVDNVETLFYGVTYVISMEAIWELLRENKTSLDREGYYQEQFFSGKGVEYSSD
jgi:hypothetical protein